MDLRLQSQNRQFERLVQRLFNSPSHSEKQHGEFLITESQNTQNWKGPTRIIKSTGIKPTTWSIISKMLMPTELMLASVDRMTYHLTFYNHLVQESYSTFTGKVFCKDKWGKDGSHISYRSPLFRLLNKESLDQEKEKINFFRLITNHLVEINPS